MPIRPSASIPLAPALLAAAGLALAATATLAQSDPLSEPFPARLRLDELDGRVGFVIRGAGEREYAGHSVAMAGDVNGDGLDDILIGTGSRLGVSTAYVLFGRDGASEPWPATVDLGAMAPDEGLRLTASDPAFSRFGRSVSAAGDLDMDGFDDLALGGPQGGGLGGGASSRGAVFVVYGRPDLGGDLAIENLDGANGFRGDGWTQRATGAYGGYTVGASVGSALARVGDLNGDGFDDLAVGGRDGAGYAFPAGYAGNACVLDGARVATGEPLPSVPLLDLCSVRTRAAATYHYLGQSVAGADLNGDGLDDLLVGAPGTRWRRYCPGGSCETGRSGSAYVIWGRRDTLPIGLVDLGAPLDGIAAEFFTERFDARLGTAVAAIGDVNDDGLPDVAMGSPGAGAHGEAHVVFGRDVAGGDPGFGTEVDMLALPATQGFELRSDDYGALGSALAGVGDVSGDGIDDFVVTQPDQLFGLRTRGILVFGRAASGGDPPFPATVAVQDLDAGHGVQLDTDASAGASVAGGGDINGDGLPDVLVGAPGSAGPGAPSASGQIFVVFGRTACRPDLDRDGALTIFDFLAFGNLFDLMDPAADFDGDGEFTIFDFLAFQNAFDAGCP